MKKKYIILNIITVLFPILFSWLIPMFILAKLNQIAQTTYNPYPRFLADSISGVLLGLLLSFLWLQYLSKSRHLVVGFLAAFIISLLQEINLYTIVVTYNGSTGSATLIHMFLGMYLFLFIYSVYKKKQETKNGNDR